MTPREWAIVGAFAATVYALSLVSPTAALLLGGTMALLAFSRGDIGAKVLSSVKGITQ